MTSVGKEEHCLAFMNIVHESNMSWVIDDEWNSIFYIDKVTKNIQYFDFPKLCFSTGQSYVYIAKWEQKIILIPQYDSLPIYIINHQKHRLLYIFKNKGCWIRKTVQNKNILYIFLNDTDNPCIKFDISNENICTDVKLRYTINVKNFDVGRMMTHDKMIWTVLRNTNYFFSMEYDSKSICTYEVGDNISFDYGFSISNGTCYAIANGGEVLICVSVDDIHSGVMNVGKYDLKNRLDGKTYTDLWVSDNVVWLFGGNEETICKLCLVDDSVEEIVMPVDFRWNKNRRFYSNVRFFCVDEKREYLFFYPRCSNGILVINKISNVAHCIPLKVDMNEIIRRQAREVELKGIEYGIQDNIDFLLTLLSSHKTDILSKKNPQKGIGKSIYDFVLQ